MSRSDAPGAPPSPDSLDALKPGARIGEFIVERVLGVGGFGIVYLAVDQVLLRQVAVKEYLPTVLAGRGADGRVTLRSPSHRDTFDAGLRSFVNEAQLLARFDHPSLVKVHRFWETNGTAYMAMPYYDGQVASHRRFTADGPVDDTRLRAFLDPLLDAIEQLHRADVYHRDISPDNILLLPGGRPVLLDFGAARRVIGDRTQTLTAVLKPSFAPVEQYGDVPGMRQGPWTDLYALGAVAHHLVTGLMPPPAAVRAVRDAMPVLAEAPASSWPLLDRGTRAAIDWMLAVVPDQRPQSVKELRDALDGIGAAAVHPARAGGGPATRAGVRRVAAHRAGAVATSACRPVARAACPALGGGGAGGGADRRGHVAHGPRGAREERRVARPARGEARAARPGRGDAARPVAAPSRGQPAARRARERTTPRGGRDREPVVVVRRQARRRQGGVRGAGLPAVPLPRTPGMQPAAAGRRLPVTLSAARAGA